MLSVLAFFIGPQEVILILVLFILLFGAAKLPQLGTAIGQGIKNFKRGMREVREEDEAAAAKQLTDENAAGKDDAQK